VADAHLVFVNGLHLEEFLDELIENAGGEAPVVAISMNVDTRAFDEDEGRAHPGVDPHIWLTPANAVMMVRNIEQALSELDPANAAAYQANARAYQAQLEALDAWVKVQIEGIPVESRRLVTDHNVFGYYADRYDLEIVGAVIPAYSANSEPSAQELADLQKAIDQYEAKAVFVGATANSALAKRVAEDTNIQVVPLFTGSLGPPGSGAETYIDYIRYNTTAIVETLK
jgi:ABC-type Zn uptake system ZnuABC Zn-binding protein ZnuA